MKWFERLALASMWMGIGILSLTFLLWKMLSHPHLPSEVNFAYHTALICIWIAISIIWIAAGLRFWQRKR